MSKSRYLTCFLSQILILWWEYLKSISQHCQEYSVSLLTIVTKTYSRSLAFVPFLFLNFLCPLSHTHQCPNPDNYHPLSASMNPTVSTFTSHDILYLAYLTYFMTFRFIHVPKHVISLIFWSIEQYSIMCLFHIFFLHLSNVGYFDFISWLFWTTLSWNRLFLWSTDLISSGVYPVPVWMDSIFLIMIRCGYPSVIKGDLG